MRLTWSLGLAAAAAVLAVGGCATQEAGDGSWTPLATPRGPIDDSRACVAAQRREVRVAAYRLQRVVVRVLREEEPQAEHAQKVRGLVRGVEQAVDRRCGERSALEPLSGLVAERVGDARGALDEPTLRLVVDAFEEWAGTVGAAGPGTVYYHRQPCVPFRRGVDVAVEVVRADTPEGPVVRVALVVDNRLDERIYVEHGGRILVDGLAPDGRERRLSWGGSSADTAAAGPGRTSRSPVWAAQAPDVDIPVVPGAKVEISEVYAVAYSKVSCRVDARLRGSRGSAGSHP